MGVKKNIIYSSILTVSGYLFPMLTFPYVTRKLGVNSFGICNFYDGVVNYFILFSMLGIVNLGIREIAKCRKDLNKIRETFQSLFALNLCTTIIAIISLILLGNYVDKLSAHPKMIYIGVAKVLAYSLLIEWLYKGLEDFRYITIRSIIVRSAYVIAVFIFIKDSEDYVLYFGLTTAMFLVNAIINIYNARNYIFHKTKWIGFRNYIKPFFILGIYQLLTSMYTTFNVVYLGFICDETQVGYYSTATKLYTIIISFYTAFTGVMLPRMSALLAEQRIDEFKAYIDKSINLLYSFCVPVILISIVFSPFIVTIVAGDQFDGAVSPMRIVMPLMVIIGLEQVLVYQVLFPQNNDKAILANSIIGAVIGITLNIILVPLFQSTGTAISWLCSECSVLISAYIWTRREINISLNWRYLYKLCVLSIPIVALLFLIDNNQLQTFKVAIPISVIILIVFVVFEVFVFKKIDINNLRKVMFRR